MARIRWREERREKRVLARSFLFIAFVSWVVAFIDLPVSYPFPNIFPNSAFAEKARATFFAGFAEVEPREQQVHSKCETWDSEWPVNLVETNKSRLKGQPQRFPPYGTPEFSRRCSWLINATRKKPSNCTFFYGPSLIEHEGISWWAGQIVSSHLLALQAGCKLIFNYGTDVDIHEVLSLSSACVEPAINASNWSSQRCEEDENCFEIPHPRGGNILKSTGKNLAFEIPGRKALAPVPRYRYAYTVKRFRKSDNIADELEQVFPGFNLETGMACSLGVLFHMAPNASRFEPNLLTKMLPALRDKEALVIGVYIRTGWADANLKGGKTLPSDRESVYRMGAQKDLDFALQVEKEYLTGKTDRERVFSKIVWMLSTDTPQLKDWITNEYDGNNTNAAVPQEQKKYPSAIIPRKVITSGSKGLHTRASIHPSTEAFATAFIDWYLLGETDVVLSNSYSFADTAALRTARPVYKHGRFNPLLQP